VWINQRLKLSTKCGIRRIEAILSIKQQQYFDLKSTKLLNDIKKFVIPSECSSKHNKRSV